MPKLFKSYLWIDGIAAWWLDSSALVGWFRPFVPDDVLNLPEEQIACRKQPHHAASLAGGWPKIQPTSSTTKIRVLSSADPHRDRTVRHPTTASKNKDNSHIATLIKWLWEN